MPKKKDTDSFVGQDRYQYELEHALESQKDHTKKMRKEIQGYGSHGGLGREYLIKLKVIVGIIIGILLGFGGYLFYIKHEHAFMYMTAVLFAILVFAIFLWRRVVDTNLE